MSSCLKKKIMFLLEMRQTIFSGKAVRPIWHFWGKGEVGTKVGKKYCNFYAWHGKSVFFLPVFRKVKWKGGGKGRRRLLEIQCMPEKNVVTSNKISPLACTVVLFGAKFRKSVVAFQNIYIFTPTKKLLPVLAKFTKLPPKVVERGLANILVPHSAPSTQAGMTSTWQCKMAPLHLERVVPLPAAVAHRRHVLFLLLPPHCVLRNTVCVRLIRTATFYRWCLLLY